MTKKTVKRCREYWFPLVVGLVLALWGTAPYLYARSVTPDGLRHMGFVGRGTQGKCGYMMFAKQAHEGHFFFENRMSPEPLPRRYASIEWWIFGATSRLLGLSLIGVYHLGRVLGVLTFAMVVYFLASQILASVFRRRLALLLVCFGSGLGWILLLGDKLAGLPFPHSSDLKGNVLAAYLINNPHFVREAIFASLKFAFLIVGERTGKCRYFVYSGLAACGQTAIRPFHLTETHLVCILYPLLLSVRDRRWSMRRFLNYLIVLAVHAPMLAFTLYVTRGNPLGVEGLTLAEGYFNPGWGQPRLFWETAFWIGLPFVLCCVSLPWLLTRKAPHRPDFLLAFAFLVAGLLYNAYPYWGAGLEAAFFVFGALPPLLVLGRPLTWCIALVRRVGDECGSRRYARRLTVVSLFFLSLPSTIYVYAFMFVDLARTDTHETYYLSQTQCRLLDWLERETPPSSVVIAEPRLSQYIPSVVHNKVVVGHTMLTPQFAHKLDEVLRFYDPSTAAAFRLDLVRRYGVRYLIAPHPVPWSLGDHPWMKMAYVEDDLAVYEILP